VEDPAVMIVGDMEVDTTIANAEVVSGLSTLSGSIGEF
jgi:hypothetical protein